MLKSDGDSPGESTHIGLSFLQNLISKVKVSYARFKHWFQFDYTAVQDKSTVVIAMFRDPYGKWERRNVLFFGCLCSLSPTFDIEL